MEEKDFEPMKNKAELLSLIKKDVISVLINILDDKFSSTIANTTDLYWIYDRCEYRALAVGYKITIDSKVYEITSIDLELMGGGLTDTSVPDENTQGIAMPYSAIQNVYVKEVAP